MDYIPSTRRILDLLMHREWGPPCDEAEARGPYSPDSAMAEWDGDVLSKLPKAQYKSGRWPSTPELREALRAVMRDQRGNYAGDRAAFALARCGCDDAEVIAALNPWDALPFRWRAAGLSAAALLLKFRAAGVAAEVAGKDLDQIDAWLADPASALHPHSPGIIAGLLFGDRRASALLHSDEGRPRYDALLAELAKRTTPPLAIANVTMDDGGGRWSVAFDLEGQRRSLQVEGDDTWMNDGAFLVETNALLAALGRPERAFKLGPERGDGGFWGRYLVAPAEPFLALCGEPAIPIVQQP